MMYKYIILYIILCSVVGTNAGIECSFIYGQDRGRGKRMPCGGDERNRTKEAVAAALRSGGGAVTSSHDGPPSPSRAVRRRSCGVVWFLLRSSLARLFNIITPRVTMLLTSNLLLSSKHIQ